MPNGVMTGDGTRENPFIVMDAHDFNALRNIPATTQQTAAFIELGADINLGVFPNFTSIPGRFFNIDGKGHKIHNYTSAANGTSWGLSAGLFTSLTVTEYCRNLVIEGMVSVSPSGTGSGSAGLLASTLSVAGPTGNNAIFENIETYGVIDVSSMGTSTSVVSGGGIAGTVNVGGSQRATFRNCFFKGVAQCLVSNTATSAGPILVFGGIVGRIDLSFSGTAVCDLCIADVSLFVGGTNGARMGVFGSILGDFSGPTNSSTQNRSIAVFSSIGKLTISFNNIGEFNRPLMFSGIIGRNDTSTASSGGAGMTTEIMNCGGFLEINYDPAVPPMGVLDFNGLHGHGARAGIVSSSYVVIEYNNPNDKAISATFNIRGLGTVNASGNVFWDETVLRRTWSGDVAQPDRGRTTAQLQSQSFLESEGWVFADGS